LENRPESRLLVIHRRTRKLEHKRFYQIGDYLEKDDLLVLNNTRVIPARLLGRKTTGAKIEFLLLNFLGNNKWKVLVKPGGKLKVGNTVVFSKNDEKLEATVISHEKDGTRIVEFSNSNEELWQKIEKIGHVPLPPYIRAKIDNPDRYQTVYAKEKGAVAAPTAGLHFTKELLEKLKNKGVKIAEITLHVGLGTFKPVQCENIKDHIMHEEFYTISEETAKLINSYKEQGKRIIPTGTTSVRTLETVAKLNEGKIKATSGWSNIFIRPGFNFNITNACITNFHLPKSTLIMLVSALADKELIFKAYEEAIKNNYRFYSYGDCMFIE